MDKKIDIAKKMAADSVNILRCPLCGNMFSARDNSVICERGHTFDISKKGYINLFCGSTKIVKLYDRELFTARKKVSDSGLYKPMCSLVAQTLNSYGKNRYICDAGSGGGNVTFDIKNEIYDSKFYALDLSKDGIEFAATNFFDNDILWMVGNLNEMPFADDSFEAVINVMSPANYTEFKRIIKADGILIKVLIESEYLSELRRFIYNDSDKNEYSNRDVLSNMAQSMDIIEEIPLKYRHTLQNDELAALFDMTPLTAEIGDELHSRESIRASFLERGQTFDVTLSFKIVVCK